MSEKPLGQSGLSIRPFVLGGNVFGMTAGREASFAVLDRFVELGGGMIDTADVYSAWVPGHTGGESESMMGAWLKQSGTRDKVLIATKVGMMPGGLKPDRIREAAQGSLDRLGTDVIDLYFAHKDDPDVPLDEVLGAFAELLDAGIVRAIGASNYSAERLAEALRVADSMGLPRFTAMQPELNLLDRDQYEGALQRLCIDEFGKGAQHFIERHVGIVLVREIKVDDVRAETVERALCRFADAVGLQAAGHHADLGRYQHAIPRTAFLQPRAHHAFGFAALMARNPRRIDIGGVDHPAAKRDEAVEHSKARIASRGHAKDIAAQNEGPDRQAALPQCSFGHCPFSFRTVATASRGLSLNRPSIPVFK